MDAQTTQYDTDPQSEEDSSSQEGSIDSPTKKDIGLNKNWSQQVKLDNSPELGKLQKEVSFVPIPGVEGEN